METAARQLIECHDPRIAQICDGLWEHSLVVAILSHDLVQALPGLDAEAAYLAGLLHDIGRPVVAEMLLEAEGRLLGKRVDHWIMPSKWLDIIVRSERTVGLAVTRSWTLPEAVVDAVGVCDAYDQSRPFRLANAVRLANALAAVSGHDLTTKPETETATVVEEGNALLGLDGETVAGVLASLPGRLAGRMA
jgi:putative nucleotidyltransferase with HDIG domain